MKKYRYYCGLVRRCGFISNRNQFVTMLNEYGTENAQDMKNLTDIIPQLTEEKPLKLKIDGYICIRLETRFYQSDQLRQILGLFTEEEAMQKSYHSILEYGSQRAVAERQADFSEFQVLLVSVDSENISPGFGMAYKTHLVVSQKKNLLDVAEALYTVRFRENPSDNALPEYRIKPGSLVLSHTKKSNPRYS